MDHGLDDHMLLISQVYPSGAYTQMAPQLGETKQVRRRRKKSKGTDDGGPKKRKLSTEQVNLLERSFGSEHKLESERKDQLATELGLDPRQVAVWFQNRRARWKSQKLEEEYNKLKAAHENIILEKCRLESEVLKLREQLSDAEKEIGRLTERSSSNSPSSSLTMEAIDAPFLGDFAAEYDNFFYVPENNYVQEMEWVNFYM